VAFGPLKSLGTLAPVAAKNWRPEAIADATELLLKDPELRRLQIAAALSAGEEFTWAATANQLVTMYRTLLCRPPVRSR
jgi:glycosyltransferase involved in cell wall biosynthesis